MLAFLLSIPLKPQVFGAISETSKLIGSIPKYQHLPPDSAFVNTDEPTLTHDCQPEITVYTFSLCVVFQGFGEMYNVTYPPFTIVHNSFPCPKSPPPSTSPPALPSLSRDTRLPLSLPFPTTPAVTFGNALALSHLDPCRALLTVPCFLFFLPLHHWQVSPQIHLPHLFP